MDSLAAKGRAMTGWEIVAGTFLNEAEIRNTVLISAEKGAGDPTGSKIRTSRAETLVAEADSLNNRDSGLPGFLRRILRRQGRINRTIVAAADAVFEEIEAISVSLNAEDLAKIREKLDRALALNSKARGNELMRRVNRPQAQLNGELNAALSVLSSYVTEKGRNLYPCDDRSASVESALFWHVREAAYRNGLRAKSPGFFRRIGTDQFLINRCHIIVIRLICELLSQQS